MRLTILAAADLNWGIGVDGKLPWHIPDDLSHFRDRTMSKTIVMGRKTAESLPFPLVGRNIAVLTRNPVNDGEFTFDGLMDHLQHIDDEIIVAGGSEVYLRMLPYCQRAEITRIHDVYDCDTYMADLSLYGWSVKKTSSLSPQVYIEKWKP